MGQFIKQHKIIPIAWEFHVLLLANFTLALVGENIENCDRKLVTPKFSPSSL